MAYVTMLWDVARSGTGAQHGDVSVFPSAWWRVISASRRKACCAASMLPIDF
jgi:hypothetical protein